MNCPKKLSMAKSLPLYEKLIIKRPTQRALDIAIFILLISLVAYRVLLMYNHGFSHLQTIAFLCEFWFSFVWFLAIVTRWNPVDFKTYPQRLLKREVEYPAVDIFVTTADPMLEPPIITVNTVLSLMALDYPSNKLSCYVSDDGCSPLTFYALNEALNFAKIWIPFCKKYDVQVRAPFMYFSTPPHHLHSSTQFQYDWKTLKVEYEKLERKIKEAEENRIGWHEESGIDLAAFSNISTKHHPSIIKILWENKEVSDELPHLIYVSREKSFKHHHHYKAGAMNVLTRVSGVLTNAPYILNVDCDMFVNNPQVVLHAMCVFLNSKDDLEDIGYVQTPQCFYDGLKDDPFGNQLVVVFEYSARGIMGLQGPFYSGTGCFHRRKVLYAQFPHHTIYFLDGKASEQELIKTFGYSKTFAKSATYAFKDQNTNTSGYPPKGLLNNNLEAANQVAGCGYEISTSWGSEIGWMYGSTSEDVLTGLVIQTRGWRSIFLALNPPAFLGCAPSQLVASLTQQKRWASGFLQVLLNRRHCPIFGTLFGKLQWKQCAAYLWILTWGLRSIPELSYTLLPPYCLITNSSIFPTVKERAIFIPIFLFIIYNFQQLLQYKETGQSIRAWWNNQKMGRVNTMCAWLFGVWDVVLKFLGERETAFEVTKKETCSEINLRHFTFDESPMFVLGTTILLLQLIALFIRLERPGSAVLEVVCSIWLLLCFWPFLKGIFMFGRGRYGLSFSTIYKSVAIALLFVLLCQTTTMN
ncbi:cellulose synthase-like protein H1 [Cucumis melo]|uniref:Cellulose synthase-like protein H1 n=1 Tax=Cucumis melo TaxID=3656 RepID=A0A1S3C389_CUCME|nr:cellulose synthase-like protein H1 [Cucumis melo]